MQLGRLRAEPHIVPERDRHGRGHGGSQQMRANAKRENGEEHKPGQGRRHAEGRQNAFHGCHRATNPKIIKSIAPGVTTLLPKVRNPSDMAPGSLHLRMAPNVTPRSRRQRRKKVEMAAGSRNSKVPGAMTVQPVMPDPSCAGMNGGAVCASRLVIISANASSFRALLRWVP